MKRRGAITLTYEGLANALGLDDRHEILSVNVFRSDFVGEKISIMVSGPCCLKVPEAEAIPPITIDNGKIFHLVNQRRV